MVILVWIRICTFAESIYYRVSYCIKSPTVRITKWNIGRLIPNNSLHISCKRTKFSVVECAGLFYLLLLFTIIHIWTQITYSPRITWVEITLLVAWTITLIFTVFSLALALLWVFLKTGYCLKNVLLILQLDWIWILRIVLTIFRLFLTTLWTIFWTTLWTAFLTTFRKIFWKTTHLRFSSALSMMSF